MVLFFSPVSGSTGTTPTADLTIEEFARIDLPQACDPPAFIAAERTRHLKELTQKKLLDAKEAAEKITHDTVEQMQLIMDAIDSDDDDDDNNDDGKKVNETSESREGGPKNKSGKNNKNMESSSKSSALIVRENTPSKKKNKKTPVVPLGGRVRPMREKKIRASSDKSREDLNDMYVQLANVLRGASSASGKKKIKTDKEARKDELYRKISDLGMDTIPGREAIVDSADEQGSDIDGNEDLLGESDDGEDGEDSDDDDLLILSNEEVEKKKKMWLEMNKNYLEDKKNKEIHDVASSSKGKQKVKGAKRKGNGNYIDEHVVADTATQAVMDMAKVKRLSKKINYDALKMLFPGDDRGGGDDGDGDGDDGDINNAGSQNLKGGTISSSSSSLSSFSSSNRLTSSGPLSPRRSSSASKIARGRKNRLSTNRKRFTNKRSALSARHTGSKKRAGGPAKNTSFKRQKMS
jgi:hypothetical protein